MDQLDNDARLLDREGGRLPPLQTTFGGNALQKPRRARPVVNFEDEKPYGNVFKEDPYALQDKQATADRTLKDKTTKRRSSRFGLAGLFNRSKTSEVEERLEKMGTQFEEHESLGRSGIESTEVFGPTISSSEAVDASSPMQSSIKPLRQKTSKQTVRVMPSFKAEMSVKRPTVWDPPPLFQAYPQSIRHATLHAPCLSAEAIIRLHANRNSTMNSNTDSYPIESTPPKPQRDKRLKRHTATEVLSKGEWTRKIFILVTSGYLLQYAGDGNFDRLPEKIMPLTKESAAFASDAIPGQRYVMQVSQVIDDQGTLDKETSRSVLKKLGLRSELRRSTSTFLLVLETSEEMGDWLAAVRREIHALGGKEYKPDNYNIRQAQSSLPQLQQRPSQRYLVTRDPNRFQEKRVGLASDVDHFKDRSTEECTTNETEIPLPSLSKRHSLATQSSVVSRSISNTTSSINQVYLDRLRESPRESYASADAKTASTSRESSPRLSPVKVESEMPDLTQAFAEVRPKPSVNPGSVQLSSPNLPTEKSSHRDSRRPHRATSPSRQSARNSLKNGRTPSPAAPNFSVPSFSKRYSTAKGSPPLLHTTAVDQALSTSHEILASGQIIEEDGMDGNQASNISEPQNLRKRSHNTPRVLRKMEKEAELSSVDSPVLCDPPLSSEGERPFSRRFSSPEYSQGVSPIRLAKTSPPPHPPPTTALPAIPSKALMHRASLSPPPTTDLPPIPTAGKLSQRYSMMPPPTTALPPLPVVDPSPVPIEAPLSSKARLACSEKERSSHVSFATPPASTQQDPERQETSDRPSLSHMQAQRSEVPDSSNARRLRRPISTLVRTNTVSDQPPFPSPQTGFKTSFKAEGLTPPLDESPPKPTREPPRPPLQQGYVQGSRSSARIGREPPPVESPTASPRSRISISSRAESYFDGPAPHPFIPPIRVSERKFRGSLDGPWNAPQRNFFDLSVN